jgi:hypothetical protein
MIPDNAAHGKLSHFEKGDFEGVAPQESLSQHRRCQLGLFLEIGLIFLLPGFIDDR